ncbi:MAG TPA: penicillin-binding transpeptidase domain-containing protein [Solirubrobacter sp.]|nr:penicillin-binding transpeptidase domain-containing protein [Solirubrobacter sp.]
MARRRRRRTRSLGYSPRAGSLFLSQPKHARRRQRRGPSLTALLVGLVVLGGLAAGAYALVQQRLDRDDRRAAVERFVAAWERGDHAAMYELLDRRSRAANPRISFLADYRRANRAAGVEKIRIGRFGPLTDGTVKVGVSIATDDFGTLRGTIAFRTSEEDGEGRVAWTRDMRLPGLRPGEDVHRRSGKQPKRGEIFAAGGQPLNSDPTGASIAGEPGPKPTGLERIYDERLGGRPNSTLRFGDRVIARVPGRKGRDVHTTIQLGLQRTAKSALGDRLGGVAVIRPRDGAVLALAGLAVSAPQPPGSSFKIVTLAAALQAGVVDPSDSFPVQTAAVLSGVRLRNAGDEACGGSLATSFAHSCNSVFGPIGAKLGAKRLVAAAERFGFNQQPDIPAAKPSTIPKASELEDDLAVGASAIGQDKDLATPLGMASVGATIANRGVRVKPHVAGTKRVRKRVVSAKVAAQVRDMMVGVVRGGTGTAAAIPGVTVAGKTGTAELVPTADAARDPRNTTAWFVAFAPAEDPRVAVAVMLPGAGQGGESAAPLARQVLLAAL